MVPHLLQPLPNRLKGEAARDVVDKEDTNGLPVVGVRDGTVALLPSRVPYLRPDQDILHLDVVRGELNSNRGVRLSLEGVLRVSEK